MPFTPIHFGGPVLLLGIAIWVYRGEMVDFWKNSSIYWIIIFVGSVIPDIQGIYSIFFDQSVPLHGFSHTLGGSIVYSVVFTLLFEIVKYFMLRFKSKNYWLDNYKLNFYTSSVLRVFATIWLSIIVLHLIPDVIIYSEMEIFWPISTNKYGSYDNYGTVASYLMIGFLVGSILILSKYLKLKSSKNLREN